MKSKNLFITSGVVLMLAVTISGVALGERPPLVNPGLDMAMVHGGPGAKARDIYAIEFIAIDGRNIEPRQTLWLEPGQYELKVRILNRPIPRTLTLRSRSEDGFDRISVELEAGKRYDIRAHLDRYDRSRPYTVVLHNVTEHSHSR